MRLDKFLFKNGYTESRSRAVELIKRGLVEVDGKVVFKPSLDIENQKVEILKELKYVSRSGEKLEAALNGFGISVKDNMCLDVGASTGGFTQCLLNNGAKLVYAVDVGKGQLHDSLRGDSRVFLFEETDIRSFECEIMFDFASIDVSFISLRLVLTKVFELVKAGGGVVALFKPQFEVGRDNVKKGVVRDEKIVDRTMKELIEFAKGLGFEFKGSLKSPIKGKQGNQEYLLYFKK